jgi:hypothetical protein
MSTGLILMSRSNGFNGDILYWLIRPFLTSYLERLGELAKRNDSYPSSDADITRKSATGLIRKFMTKVEDDNSREDMLKGQAPDGKFDRKSRKFEDIDPEEEKEVRRALEEGYSKTLSGDLKWDPAYFAIKDMAKRVNSGTGSLGLPRYYVLIEGPTDKSKDDIILDVKLQTIPTPVIFWSWYRRERYEKRFGENHALGFVEASKAMQSNEDPHLGWLQTSLGSFSVRQRSPWKGALDISLVRIKPDYVDTCRQWGYIVANAHARSRGRWLANPNFVKHVWEKRLEKGARMNGLFRVRFDRVPSPS